MKTKPRGYVEIVQDGNNELTVGDDVFQFGELVIYIELLRLMT